MVYWKTSSALVHYQVMDTSSFTINQSRISIGKRLVEFKY